MGTLKREMAKVIYKEKDQIVEMTKKISMLKVRNSSQPGSVCWPSRHFSPGRSLMSPLSSAPLARSSPRSSSLALRS